MLTRLRSPDAAARWLREWTRGSLRTDSRRVQPGDAFIAWPGTSADGRRFVDAALRAGATTCLVEAEGVESFGFDDARIGALPGLKATTGAIADAYFDRPTERLRVAAVTGTNGKTSCAWWIAQALTLAGRRCGLVGTLGIGVPPVADAPGAIDFTGLTTPDPVVLQQGFRRMADEGLAACAIEASSIGVVEQRLAGTRIQVAVFTNFTRDHLDYHGSMAAYWQAKRGLFAWPGLRAAVINIDDAQGAALAAELRGPALDVWTTSLARRDARLHATDLHHEQGGLAFTVHEGAQSIAVQSALIGDYNAANLLGVIGALRAMGLALDEACAAVPRLTPVPGRMQRVGDGVGAPEVIVDYAHTPDALEKALAALRPLADARGGKLVCVFGCGGDRDASKRPLMGAAAERLADAVVLTSDNPRREEPQAILAGIVAGLSRPSGARVIEDRRVALATAVAEADARDVVLVAGKGHEDYQEIHGIKHPFDDAIEARAALRSRAGVSA
jgi:UDP-N-acetylmuramoyl-L-alanyl-D-glutamate--2,6-diaminopimelate ligase